MAQVSTLSLAAVQVITQPLREKRLVARLGGVLSRGLTVLHWPAVKLGCRPSSAGSRGRPMFYIGRGFSCQVSLKQ